MCRAPGATLKVTYSWKDDLPVKLHQLAWATAVVVGIQMVLAGVIVGEDAGFVCPNWPLCGKAGPVPVTGSLIFELAHRFVAALLGDPAGELLDIATATPRTVLAVRQDTLGYVSQFLRVVPRVPALDVVAEVLVARGTAPERAREAATALLLQLNISRRLHDIPPATFSGGEQQRVNLARGFIAGYPVLLLDEPTASLDAENRRVVVRMIQQAKAHGTAIVAICHDADVRDAIADRLFSLSPLEDAA